MWGLFAGVFFYGSSRPKTGQNAGGTLFLFIIAVVWIVAGVLEVLGVIGHG